MVDAPEAFHFGALLKENADDAPARERLLRLTSDERGALLHTP